MQDDNTAVCSQNCQLVVLTSDLWSAVILVISDSWIAVYTSLSFHIIMIISQIALFIDYHRPGATFP